MTEDQKKKYEQAAFKYRESLLIQQRSLMALQAESGFIAGAEHAHPEGYKVGYRDGHDSGWNAALDALKKHYEGEIENARRYRTHPEMLTVRYSDIFEELKRLKR